MLRPVACGVLLAALTAPAAARPDPAPAAPVMLVPSVQLPDTVSGQPGEWVVVPARVAGGGRVLKWYFPDAGLSPVGLAALFGEEWQAHAAGTVVRAGAAGRYRVVAWTASAGQPSEAAVCVVVVGAPTPPPVPPPVPPTPVPPPPQPPTPVPPPEPPTPADPQLVAALQAAYAADPLRQSDPEKAATALQALAMHYKAARITAGLDKLTTCGALINYLRDELQAKVPADRLVGVRRALADEFKAKLPSDPAAPLDRAARDLYAAEFTRVAAALEAVK